MNWKKVKRYEYYGLISGIMQIFTCWNLRKITINLMIACVPARFESSPSRIQVTDITDCMEFLSVATMNETNFIDTVTVY
jgi:hypothetical protein